MQYRHRGKVSFCISDVIIGNMMFGLRTDENDLRYILGQSADMGIREFDTSPSYINGESDRLLADLLRSEGIGNVIVHSKIGSRLKSLSLKEWNSHREEFERIAKGIKAKFDGIELGALQLHCNFSDGTLEEAINFLEELREKDKQFKMIGFCNISENILNSNSTDHSDIQHKFKKRISHQNRFFLDGNWDQIPTSFNNWAYGMLNGGSVIDKNSKNPLARINTARDKADIHNRSTLIHKYIIESELKNLCKDAGVLIQDYAVAMPLIVGYDKIIIGPSRRYHLDIIERLLDPIYFERLVEIHKRTR